MKMNPDLKVEAQNTRVGEDTQNIYTDTFMESLTGVANALDNGKKIYSPRDPTNIFKLTHVYIWIVDVSITDFRSLNQEPLEQWVILKWSFRV